MPYEDEYLETRTEHLIDSRGLTRRQLVMAGGAAVPLALGLGRPARSLASVGQAPAPPILKDIPPEWFIRLGTNAEMRWDTVRWLGYTIPNPRFFVRNHTATPTIDLKSWNLRLFGDGLKGAGNTFTYEQLRELPAKEITAFVECAGNGRSFFGTQQGTPAPGSQWGLGAIGVARWRGVPLAEVLERAGVTKQAVDVMPYGLDAHVVTAGVDYGNVRRPIPIAKALGDALLAYEMNGAMLPPDHGFPLRLIVPGWIGVANIKWIGQIEISRQPLHSLWNTQQYRMLGDAYPADSPPISTQVVKSAWELPWNATLPYRTRVPLTGRAWSGTSAISRVDVSIDQGRTWTAAKLDRLRNAGSWTRFTYSLPPLPSGSYQLWARATDRAGRVQPPTVPFNTNGYLFEAIVRHPVTVD
jgi:DMSO/TMAO reductase YedYZ molybdopterin-dependent catalytic subunit